ncbi:bacteriocin [Mesotoga sp. SC_3PWM13N19]|nr:bacteriocin [Mesotoga sp. SC_3PWM13N19]
MDLFKRQLAPLSSEAWEEINERAKQVLKSYLSARKIVNVVGPKGWEYSFLPEGRVKLLDREGEIGVGLRKAKPLIEARIPFKLVRWQMDDIERGAKDSDLAPLENAVKQIALFEERVIYNGYEKASVEGIVEASENDPIPLGSKPNEIIESLSRAVQVLKDNFTDGPFVLVVNPDTMSMLNSHVSGYPLVKRIESFLGSEIVVSRVLKDALLLPKDHEDLEMVIGGDFEIGYQSSTDDEVELFITESFTFRVLDPAIIVKLTV